MFCREMQMNGCEGDNKWNTFGLYIELRASGDDIFVGGALVFLFHGFDSLIKRRVYNRLSYVLLLDDLVFHQRPAFCFSAPWPRLSL